MLEKYFPEDWITALGAMDLQIHLANISNELVNVRKTCNVLPEVGSPLLFQAFRETPFSKVKICIVGMDIYHGVNEFNGLAFGNGPKVGLPTKKISPSLRTILAEVERSEYIKANPSLYSWANQGVLLINTAHSVEEGVAGQHIELWRSFTELVFKALNTKFDLVWMLWGSKAQAYEADITNSSHSILKAGHPSPLNRTYPFYGCNCFADCNSILKAKNIEQIIWN